MFQALAVKFPVSPYMWAHTAQVAWLNGNSIAHINQVTLRRARLVLGSVTVSGFHSWCGTGGYSAPLDLCAVTIALVP